MRNMTLTQITEVCDGKLYYCENSQLDEVSGVVVDSRKVEKDYLFIATKGERVDGHDFIESSFRHGALAVVCEKLPEKPYGPCILVDDSFLALKAIAKMYRQQLHIKVVGITGSVGKTSTKEFISSVLSTGYQVLKTEGNFNNEIGLPLTILRIRDEHEVAVLEMGISDFGEMHRLSEIACPDICVLTNIGQCHLENLGSREGILKAKSEIFDFMHEDGRVVVNGDDDMLATIHEVKGSPPVRFGIGTNNDVYADHITSNGLFGSVCDIHYDNKILTAQIPLPGEHMVLNALAATSVGYLLGISSEQIAAGIAGVKPLGGRSNIIRHHKYTVIDDCYNANPVSMKAALDLLGSSGTRKVAILGDMAELGDNSPALHKEIGSYAANGKAEVLIFVGSLAKLMYEEAKEQLSGKESLIQLYYYKTQKELFSVLADILLPKDTILIKASHSMQFENIVSVLLK